LEPRLKDPSLYLGVELDAKMRDFLVASYPKLRFEQGFAQNLLDWTEAGSVDAIVSSLPWTLFSEDAQIETIEAIYAALKPGGVFVTYICLNAVIYPSAAGFLRRLRARFPQVDRTRLELRNIPPAYVYRARK
jgi:phospholipid N-methyltransferase